MVAGLLRTAMCILVLVALAACGAQEASRRAVPAISGGVLDLRDWDFARDGTVNLDGDWELVWGRFEAPDAPGSPQAAPAAPVRVPGAWNDVLHAGRPVGADGHGTYRLVVGCHQARGLALALPVQHSAARVFANGRLIANQGEPADSADRARPAPVRQIVDLGEAACPVRLVIHMSNFDMRRGGMLRSLELGQRQQLHALRERAIVRDVFTLGVLSAMVVMPLLFWFARRRDRSPLYFGLFSLAIGTGLALSSSRVLEPLVAPLGWDAYQRIVFLCWFWATTVYVLFLGALYPQQVRGWPVRLALFWAGGSSVVVLATPARVFSHLVPVLQAGSAALALYAGVQLVLALRAGHRNAAWLLGGLAVFAAAVVHDTFNFSWLQRDGLVPYALFVFALAPAVLLAQRFARALSAQELRSIEQRERVDLLVRSTKAGVLDWKVAEGTLAYSERFREMLGLPAAAQPPFHELVHPEDRERVREHFERQQGDLSVRSAVRPLQPLECRLLLADGNALWVHAEGVAVCGADGRPLRLVWSFIDVSERKHHEIEMSNRLKAIDDLVTRLDTVVRGAQVGVVDWDGRTHATYYSPRFREIRGYAPDADTSQWPDYFKVMIHPDDRARITRRWVAFIRGEGPEGPRGEYYAPEEYRMLRADGSYAWVQVSGVAKRDEQGFTVRWIAAIIDISERHAQQEALQASRDQIAAQAAQLEQQNEALKENVRLREEVERIGRHDLKTPLNSIVAVPRLLREERQLGPEADELLGIVERAGYRILSMVNLSLDLYKMEQGSYIFRPDAVDLVDLAHKVMVDVRVHAAAKNVRIEVRADDPPYAWAEELLCYSLIANLLKNAVEASPEGGRVTIAVEGAADGRVAISIHNQGAVPAAIRGNFFRKYATLGKASGTGLGAYSARLMANVQDGEVTMESGDAEGTTLRVVLRGAPAGKVPATLRHAAEQRAVDPARLASLPPVRVLLVDDDEYNLLIVRRFLPDPPFTVDTAINGHYALQQAERAWPDLLFMDLDMPVMGGLEAVGRLREMEAARGGGRTPMVALSSHEDADTRRRALDAGFDRYLTKPVTREAIQQALVELHQGLGDVVVLDPDIAPVLAGFVASRRGLIDGLEAAGARGDRAELRRLAHQLAGSFGLYGFGWASECSRALEKGFESVTPEQVSEAAAQLRRHLDTVEIRFQAAGA